MAKKDNSPFNGPKKHIKESNKYDLCKQLRISEARYTDDALLIQDLTHILGHHTYKTALHFSHFAHRPVFYEYALHIFQIARISLVYIASHHIVIFGNDNGNRRTRTSPPRQDIHDDVIRILRCEKGYSGVKRVDEMKL